LGVDNKTPEFLKQNPLGKVPVLITPEGPIFESNAIAFYVSSIGKKRLLGNDHYEQSLILQWLSFIQSELEVPYSIWLYPILGYHATDVPVATESAKQDIFKVLSILNNHLLHRTFLVGERISLADIVASVHLFTLYSLVLSPELRSPYPNTNRWFLTLAHQPEFKEVLGEIKLCEHTTVYQPKQPAAAAHPKAEKKEKPKKEPKEPHPKAEKKPEPPKVEKPKEENLEEEEEEDKEEKPKAKNPLDFLPPSKLNFDEWKRTYSNNDTRTVANPWFWEHFDPEGYCIYSCHKKSNDLDKVWLCSNMIGGFFTRLERLHKYAFGSMVIHGTEPTLKISGVWVFRGLDVPIEMKECDDFELYDWKKIDHADPKHRTLIEDFFAWDGEFNGDGKPAAGKVFK